MFLALTLILATSLILIAWQDFRSREVWLIIIIIQVTIATALSMSNNSFQDVLWNAGINCLLAMFEFSMLFLVIYLRSKSFKKIFEEYIGWGDILFYISLTPLFSPVHFLLFILVGSFFSLLGWVICSTLSKHGNKTIPLAGLLAIFTIIVLFLAFVTGYNIGSDQWLLLHYQNFFFT